MHNSKGGDMIMKKLNKKGFTMAELLIVVAIIAVLVAIAIPVFTSQLEKSREAVDAANIRAKYAELMADTLTGDTSGKTYAVTLKQKTNNWQNTELKTELSSVVTESGNPSSGGTATLTIDADNKVTVTYN